jgi:hypothetical protein
VGVEPTTSAFWFVPVSWLPGLSLHPGSRFRWQPSSLYTRLTRNRESVLIQLSGFESTWLGITLETDMNCLNCGAETTNPKFCSSSCAARYNNKRFPKRKKQLYFCKSCGAETRYRRSYCSDCDPSKPQDFSHVSISEIRSRARYQANAWIRKLARRVYFGSDKPKRCSRCGYSNHIEICHVRSIQDFPEDTQMSVVNNLDNLIALCPNCHWELDHGLLSL